VGGISAKAKVDQKFAAGGAAAGGAGANKVNDDGLTDLERAYQRTKTAKRKFDETPEGNPFLLLTVILVICYMGYKGLLFEDGDQF
jgi:hypothetical protein